MLKRFLFISIKSITLPRPIFMKGTFHPRGVQEGEGMLERIALVLTMLSIVCTHNTRLDSSGATPEGVARIAKANNQFALDLFSQIRKRTREENIFFSPFSITTALTMTYEGARGKTAAEMESVLHITKRLELRRPNFASLINELNRKDRKYTLAVANALWAQKDYRFLKEYFQVVERYYGGKVTNIDFVHRTEKARRKINDWVEDKTEKKIKNLIPKGALTDLTRLVLTNAIYFKGNWLQKFDKKLTREEDFHTLSGEKVKVPMMNLTGDKARFDYAEVEGVQILRLPYEGGDLSMLILLPEKGRIKELEDSLDLEKLREWRNMLRNRKVNVYLPRFKLKTKYFLAKILVAMGMTSAFGAADFSGMDGTKNLFISKVIHQGFINVDEEGTEAAAATGVVMEFVAVRETPVFRADHPFLFLIQHKSSGSILFLGRLGNPG